MFRNISNRERFFSDLDRSNIHIQDVEKVSDTDRAFAQLLDQRRKVEMMRMIGNSSSYGLSINNNFITAFGMILVFVLILIVFYTFVGWVEAPFKTGSALAGTLSD